MVSLAFRDTAHHHYEVSIPPDLTPLECVQRAANHALINGWEQAHFWLYGMGIHLNSDDIAAVTQKEPDAEATAILMREFRKKKFEHHAHKGVETYVVLPRLRKPLEDVYLRPMSPALRKFLRTPNHHQDKTAGFAALREIQKDYVTYLFDIFDNTVKNPNGKLFRMCFEDLYLSVIEQNGSASEMITRDRVEQMRNLLAERKMLFAGFERELNNTPRRPIPGIHAPAP